MIFNKRSRLLFKDRKEAILLYSDSQFLSGVFYEMLIFADEGGAMFAESNPYHLILARQYSINKTFGTKLGRKRIRYGILPTVAILEKQQQTTALMLQPL